jgi:hypothetical protein
LSLLGKVFLLAWVFASWAGPVQAQAPPLAVTAEAGYGVVHIGPVLDDRSLEDAARAGLPIRLRLRVELWRSGFFDRLVGSENWTGVVLFDPLAERFTVRAPDSEAMLVATNWPSARLLMERALPAAIRPREAGRHYFTASLEVETLSLTDLEELQRWLRGELQPAVSGEGSVPAAVGTGLRRLLVRLLRLPVRRYEARSPIFSS